MRITGGIYGRRQIVVPKGECRPTQDVVRGALFSIIGERICGCRFLDLFAGSGTVGLEALSRGADLVCWVESNRKTMITLKENVERICCKDGDMAHKVRFFGGDVFSFLQKGLENQQFDLIFADPPYDREAEKGWLPRLFKVLGDGNVLAPGGVFVMEQASEEDSCENIDWALVKDKVYGGTRLRFFVRKEKGGCL
ncbi:MAG: 16S rRNA (guanine(966)-N(2))-methyltransferase RsmD [Lentisphaerae bacterium RIFOXYA12_FULL_48_11]|nr:MAG: 16S rRNA (guanine(966)-N(2))-methyltransferase RsmD [Lentisphaerae bacterium RIFOXYA12_FULL_48_11]